MQRREVLDWWDDTDDAARLVHADTLTSRGDPFGEFMLLQCTQPESPRLTELWTKHHVEWLAAHGLPPLGWYVKGPGLSSAMHRVGGTFELWSVHFQRGRLARLWAPRLSPELLARLRAEASLRQLELDDVEPDRFLDTIAGFKLEVLGVSGSRPLSRRQLEDLVEAPVFQGLAELDFNAGTPQSEADERASFVTREAQRAPRLTRLRLEGTLSLKPLRVLRSLPWTKRLTHLDVSVGDATEELPALLEHLPALEALSLGVYRAEPALAHALLAHPTLKQARIRTSAPTPLPDALAQKLQQRLGPQALVRF